MDALVTQWEARGDRRAIFLACYALMTRNMLRAVDERRFQDPVWVNRFIHDFAAYYFVALAGYDGGRPDVPGVWRRAHDLTRDPAITAIQNLMMGINAHINYDLVFTLVDLLQPEWPDLDADRRGQRYADYIHVNAIIGETIDAVQDSVVERYAQMMDVVDRVLGPLDEWCTNRLICNWRNDVWQQAMDILQSPDLPTQLDTRQRVEATALQRIDLVLDGGQLGARAFGYPLRWLSRLKLV
jgi:hypothetical protein